jgi:hypothetical protein
MKQSILHDRDGRLSLGRIMLTSLFLFAFAFLGKAFFKWGPLPEGIVAAIGSLFTTISVYVKATEAINGKRFSDNKPAIPDSSDNPGV